MLGDSVFGILLLGLFAPAAAVARIQVNLVRGPPDGSAGSPLLLDLQSSGRVRVKPIEPPGPECFVGRTRTATHSQVTLLPEHRGVHEEVLLDISTAAPFGLQWWSRRIAFPLPVPLHVAPRLGEPARLPSWVDERSGSLGRASLADAGDARGVREYRPGDRRPRVHWLASAHVGRLMVRELEQPTAQPVSLKVSLPSDGQAAERIAESALGTVVQLIDRGVPLVLETDETDGSVVGPVADRRDAGRRLARATPGSGSPGLDILP